MKHTIGSGYPVIDFGAHFNPPALQAPTKEDVDNIVGYDRRNDPETAISELNQAGGDIMVNSIPQFMNAQDADDVIDANEKLLDFTEQHEEFYALAAIPIGTGDGEKAASEFERCIDNGFQGGALTETYYKLTHEEMEPIFEVANKTDAPIFVHSPQMVGANYRFNAIFGRDHAQQKSIARTIHSGIYDRYENLNLVWHHSGGNIASMMGRIHLHTEAGRWPQEDMKSFKNFKDDFENRVYIDTAGYLGYTAPIRIALEEFPSTQILFGTDFPSEPRSAEEYRRMINSILDSCTSTDAKRILGENAMDLMINIDS